MVCFQFMLIWIANLPVDVIWYLPRATRPWQGVAWAIFLFHFAVPFFLLLMRPIKRNSTAVAWIAGLILFMQLVFMDYQVLPGSSAAKLANTGWIFSFPSESGESGWPTSCGNCSVIRSCRCTITIAKPHCICAAWTTRRRPARRRFPMSNDETACRRTAWNHRGATKRRRSAIRMAGSNIPACPTSRGHRFPRAVWPSSRAFAAFWRFWASWYRGSIGSRSVPKRRSKRSAYPLAPGLSAKLPPQPRLEQLDRITPAEIANGDKQLAAKEKALNSYGATAEKGFVHIPIGH